jgi:hypothetical protein
MGWYLQNATIHPETLDVSGKILSGYALPQLIQQERYK